MRRKKNHLHLVTKLSKEKEAMIEKYNKILLEKRARDKDRAAAGHPWPEPLDDAYPIAKELLDNIWKKPARSKQSIRHKHGTSDIMAGRLTGQTDSDYFYFWCPKCKERLRILDFDFRMLRPVMKNVHWKPKPKKEFSLIFKIYCPHCRLTDYVKLSNLN